MELPFEKKTERFWQQKLYAPVMREESQELRLPESMPDVGRVIAAWGQPVLRGKQWRDDHITIEGGVMVWVLYHPEDGSGPRRVESWLPFRVRLDHSHSGADGIIRAESVLCSADARSISARKLMLRCQVGLMVQTMVPKEAELYSPGTMPEDVQILERVYPMVLTRETGEKTFLADEQLSLPQGAAQPARILYSRLCPRVTEQKVLNSRAVFRGVGELHLLCQDEGEKLFSLDLEVPFAQYLDLEGEYGEGAEVSNLLGVTSLETDCAEGGIRVRCGLVSQYIVSAPTVIRCAADAYSPDRELELVEQEVQLPAWLDEQVRQIQMEERLAGDEVPIDAIFFPDLPMVTRQSGGSQIHFGGTFQTLCQGADGSLTGKTLRTGRDISMAGECDTIPCTWLRGGTTARREGTGWTVEARMEGEIFSVCTKPIGMVTGIRASEQKAPDPDRPSIIVRSRKAEETLWDIAKYCGSTVSAIQRLNKLESEPEENRLLLIPVI